jgi:MOSC domain-containing protein YiiM
MNSETSMITGRLIAIARRSATRAPMQEIAAATISLETGLEGDCKGAKYPRRQITLLEREAWDAAVAEFADARLPWTVRRANLLVEGLRLPRAVGGILAIGAVRLEITAQTYPCRRMTAAHVGLLTALAKHWRGGVTCRVQQGGNIALGDPVQILWRPPEIRPRLPG